METERDGPRTAAPERVVLSEPTSRSGLVRSALRDMILSRRFEPGETLVERQLAEMLGVSKTPVREALIGLAASGLVTVSTNRAVAVRRLTASDARKLFELRLLLEPWAVGRAALRPVRDLTAAAAALDEAARLLDAGDGPALSLVNRRFHRLLYAQADNELVVDQLDQIQDLVALAFVDVERRGHPVWDAAHGEHEGMLDAVRDGDAPRAEHAAREHIERAMDVFATLDG